MRKTSVLQGVAVFIAVLFIVTFIACRKTSQEQDQQPFIKQQALNNFFFVSPGTDYVVHTIAKKIEQQNERSPFIQSLVQRVGSPEWDHSLIADGPGQPRAAAHEGNTAPDNDQRVILYIPFAKEEERKTKAVLRVVIDKADTSFEMLYPQHYKKYGFTTHSTASWGAQDLFNVFANFDHDLFGTSKFLVKDGRLFGKEKSDWLIVERKMKEEVAAGNNVAARLSSITVCAYTTACVYASDNPYDGGNCVTTTSCAEYWYDDVTGAGLNTGGESPVVSGGSGTGDGSWTGDPCSEPPVVQRPAEPLPPGTPTDPGNDCGEPWEPMPEIKNDVNDPCIRKSVEYALSRDCKNEITNFINSVFGGSQVYYLQFEDGNFAGTNAATDAETQTRPSMLDINETITTIRFNNSQLGNASKEFIAATILHEAIHAWINYQFPTPVQSAAQHSKMAGTYRFSLMRSALLEMHPTISFQDATDLTWGGLYSTIEFNNLPLADRLRIIQTNLDYKNHTKGTPC